MALVKRKNSKNWYMDFKIGGRRVNRSTGTADRKTAQLVESAERLKAMKGGPLEPDSRPEMTLTVAIEVALDDRWSDTRDADNVERRLDAVLDILGDLPITDIGRGEIKAVRDALSERGLAPATINRHLANLKTLLRMAMNDWEVLDRVPYVQMYREDNARDAVLSRADEERLLDYLRSKEGQAPDLADLYEVLVETALRQGEAIALEWDRHVDLDRGFLRLTKDITKASKERVVPLSKRAEGVLARRKAAGHTRPFPYKKKNVSDTFRKARIHLELDPGLCVHSLRHTATTRLIEKGGDVYRVAKMVGHSTAHMTERYAHLSPEYLKDLVR